MSKKILVVDDSETSLFLIQSIFENNPQIDVIPESRGRKAMEELTSRKPDLVLLDILMPGLNGFEFMEQMRANAQTKEIPVIVLTALQERESEEKALELGAVEFIRKPLELSRFKQKIYRHLNF